MNAKLFLSIAVLFTVVSQQAEAKLYKWVDDQGVTHYGETIPPEYADKARAELNKSGRVVKKSKEILTEDERRAQQEAEKKQKEDEKTAREQARHDKMLINTYSSTTEIDLARKRNLQQIELRINGINSQLKIAEGNVASLQKEAEEKYINRKKAVPASLQEDLQDAQTRLDKLKKDQEKLTAEKAALNARYDADKVRYRELTGRQ